jgi:ABC-type sugar transport system ATPase subunit
MIYVTHDQVEAMTMADRIVVLRAGKVEQIGTPLELYNEPANAFVAGFIGSPRMNFLAGKVGGAEGGLSVDIDGVGAICTDAAPRDLAPGAAATIGIRPEHVALGHCGVNDVNLAVGHCEQLGGATTLFFTEPAFAVHVPGQVPARRGERIPLNLPPQHLHVFGADERALPRHSRAPAPAAAGSTA